MAILEIWETSSQRINSILLQENFTDFISSLNNFNVNKKENAMEELTSFKQRYITLSLVYSSFKTSFSALPSYIEVLIL